jgi:hypothetical protein
VDGRDAAAGARLHHDGAPTRRGGAWASGVTKGEKREDDDDDVTATSARNPLVSVHARGRGARRRLAGAWAAPGPKGENGPFGWLRPAKRVKRLSYLTFSYFLFNSNLNHNSNLNPLK